MHKKKSDFFKKLEKIKPSKDFTNSLLIEKGFKDWSLDYLEKNSFEKYLSKVEKYTRLIEGITKYDIQDSLDFENLSKVRVILDGFALSLDESEKVLFYGNSLDFELYPYNPFLFSLMLMLHTLNTESEIDKRITLLTHWLEDVLYEVDKYYTNNKRALDILAIEDSYEQ